MLIPGWLQNCLMLTSMPTLCYRDTGEWQVGRGGEVCEVGSGRQGGTESYVQNVLAGVGVGGASVVGSRQVVYTRLAAHCSASPSVTSIAQNGAMDDAGRMTTVTKK